MMKRFSSHSGPHLGVRGAYVWSGLPGESFVCMGSDWEHCPEAVLVKLWLRSSGIRAGDKGAVLAGGTGIEN